MLDNYCRSFFDLWHHLDPVAAAQFDPDSPGVTVAAFDLTGVQQHLAALRSLGFAVEELSLDELEDEVDRTLLLGAIRGLDRRFASGGPYRTNPAFWMLRLAHVLRAKPEERGMVQAVPAALQTAARTLHRPSLALVELALELTNPVRALLDESTTAGDEDGFRARTALVEFDGFLRHDLPPDPDPHAGTLGTEETDWLLAYGFGYEGQSGRALKELARRAESLEAALVEIARQVDPARSWRDLVEPRSPVDPTAALSRAFQRVYPVAQSHGFGVDPSRIRLRSMSSAEALTSATAAPALEPLGALDPGRFEVAIDPGRGINAESFAARFGPAGMAYAAIARGRADREIRRRYVTPAWLTGFGLWVHEWLDAAAFFSDASTRLAALAESLFAVLVAAIDLSVHLRQMTPGEAESRLVSRFPTTADRARAAVRGVLMDPLDAAGAVLCWNAWTDLASQRPGETAALISRIGEAGILHPPTAAWRLGG